MTSPAAPAQPKPEEPWTIRRLLTWTTGHFDKQEIDDPRLTTEILLSHALKTSRVKLYTDLERPLSKDELASFKALIQRRSAGEPTQYLTQSRLFYARQFFVDERVLIPRPETELLVSAVLELLPKDAPSRVLDLCTGSGCIAVTIAAERPQASVWAVDVSPQAAEVASLNAETLGVGGRVTVKVGDLFAPIPEGAKFDVITANAPYVKTGEMPGLQKEVQKEPKLALDGGADGLDVIRRIAAEAPKVLKAGGTLALELGDTQGDAVKELLMRAGYLEVRVEKDLARLDRLAFGKVG